MPQSQAGIEPDVRPFQGKALSLFSVPGAMPRAILSWPLRGDIQEAQHQNWRVGLVFARFWPNWMQRGHT